MRSILYALPLALLAAASPALADTAIVPCDRDNTLYENSSGLLSNGAGPTMFAGRTAQLSNSIRRALVHFNVAAAVPVGATINSVSLTLSMSQAALPTDDTIGLHRVLADWGEGTSNAGATGGGGAPATAGDATWKHRFSPTLLWATLGGDFAVAASATQVVGIEGPYTWSSTPALVADVQGWLAAPATNFGWAITGNEATSQTAKRFDTREATVPSLRPALTINYTPPGTPTDDSSWGRLKALYR
jgi:hypothetical protein